jgi:hypothetical protein
MHGTCFEESGILKGGGDKPSLKPVWVATQGFDIEVDFKAASAAAPAETPEWDRFPHFFSYPATNSSALSATR